MPRTNCTVICQRCGKSFNVKPYQVETTKYCSPACHYGSVWRDCPVCGTRFRIKRSHSGRARYCSRDCAFTAKREAALDRHEERVAATEGVPFAEAVALRHFQEAVPSHVLCKKWGMQYRAFRSLCERHGIAMKPMSQAIREQWVNADERRATTGEKLRDTLSRFDFSGENNPMRRPEVRAKLSAARKRNNPMWRPEVRAKMAATQRAKYAAHPEQHINYRMARTHLRSSIERKMQGALRAIGIDALHGQRIRRRWPDLVIPHARLVIECDGLYWHTPETADADAAREAEIRAAGWDVLRFTDKEINADAAGCAYAVARYLTEHGSPHTSQLLHQSRLFDPPIQEIKGKGMKCGKGT